MATCADCMFYRPYKDRPSGMCVRNAPIRNLDNFCDLGGKWPTVSAKAWCGEHKIEGNDISCMLPESVRLGVSDGDVVVFKCDEPLSADQASRLRYDCERALGQCKVLVLPPGMRVDSVLAKGEAAAQGVGGQKSSHSEIF
jgi:hypothetical protein